MAVLGCHLVGSTPLRDTQTALRCFSKGLHGLLLSMPDGETGVRSYFVRFQASKFPAIMQSGFLDPEQTSKVPLTDEQVAKGRQELEDMDLETGYDKAAVESYEIFKQLRSEGIIEKNVKFQVCLPTIANVVGILIEEKFRHIVEPVYETALFKALQTIQDQIPHEDLAIQIDLGIDMAYWENKIFRPWFSDKRYVVDYIVRMMSRISRDVDLGFHFCYGDIEHKHYFEPTSLGPVADLYQHIMEVSPRSVQWMHCPVPLSAMGNLDDFFKPLSTLSHQLALDHTKLYLGLVHPHDLDGTRERVAAAEKVVKEFGIATECGWGRIQNQNDIESIMDICRNVSGRFEMYSGDGL